MSEDNQQSDAVLTQIIDASLTGIVREMQTSLFRTGFSTIIRESHDASCALLSRKGELLAQHVVLPIHMGAFPACTQAVLKVYPAEEISEGDAFLINHPYLGGSAHAPDIAVITPAFFRNQLVGFCGSIAHKSDLGGPVPGSCSGKATETFNEGLHLPPVRFVHRAQSMYEIEAIIGANSRTPELVLGDIRGQTGTGRLGERRLAELLEKYGEENVLRCVDDLFRITEQKIRQAISGWKDGIYDAERFVDNDGVDTGKPIRIHVRITKKTDRILFDFTQSADQAKGPANMRPPLVRASCAYCLIALIDPFLAVNEGLLRTISFEVRDGSVLNPRFPAPMNSYNPTVHAVIDAVFDALSGTVPDKKRADGCGNRSITLGGLARSGKGYIQYEIIGGGGGARSGKDGDSGTTVNQSNGMTAPVEIIESEFPVRLLRHDLVKDSGGAGCYRGGLGILREYLILQDARLSLRSSKHLIPPSGIEGGEPGRPGAVYVNPATAGEQRLPTLCEYYLKNEDILRLETPGGGGLRDPLERNPGKVLEDVEDGNVSLNKAAEDYGVVIHRLEDGYEIDALATETLRRRKQSLRGDKNEPGKEASNELP